MGIEKHVSKRVTPQSQAILGRTDMVANSAGGFGFQLGDMERLRRFLILGSDGGTYYTGERKLTVENAECVTRCWNEHPVATAHMIAEVSRRGIAPKNDPALLALAIGAGLGLEQRKCALFVLPEVARIGTHLFTFARMVETQRGWGRGLRRAVGEWYTGKKNDDLAYQLIKYPQREGWSHRDLLRLSHPAPLNDVQTALFQFVTKGEASEDLPDRVKAAEALKLIEKRLGDGAPDKQSLHDLTHMVSKFNLPREVIPTQFLNEPKVWEALLEKMPMTALIRNLGKLSSIGVLKPLSTHETFVADQIVDEKALHRARLHPLQILVALKTYAQGRGTRGSLQWPVSNKVVDALNAAFELSFESAPVTNKRFYLGVDVSYSMSHQLMHMGGVACVEIAAAMAMLMARRERSHYIAGFCMADGTRSFSRRGNTGMVDLGISASDRLDKAVLKCRKEAFGGTDAALPILDATKKELEVDCFVTITDNETWGGAIHPTQALDAYRQKTGLAAKQIVIACTSTGFTIADPNDQNQLDVVGFDTTVPQIIHEFVGEETE